MAIIGPRPLLVRYLPRYNKEQHHRHDVRPGLTGYAQMNGRNALTWEDKFKMDVWYTKHVAMATDIGILFKTVKIVLKKEGISSETTVTMEEVMGELWRNCGETVEKHIPRTVRRLLCVIKT